MSIVFPATSYMGQALLCVTPSSPTASHAGQEPTFLPTRESLSWLV